MNVLDLFSGIGGFSLGLERAGMRTVAFVEIDPYCRAVLRKHWPGVPIFEDVRELDAAALAGAYTGQRDEPGRKVQAGRDAIDGGGIDLVCGGFPCQPWSVAGQRRGAEDDRDLWPEMRRLVGEFRPRWVLGENVPGLDDERFMALDGCLSDLEAIGYEAQALEIPACAVDAPHRRQRLWIVAHDAERGRGRQPDQVSGARSEGPTRGCCGDVADRLGARLEIGQGQPGNDGAQRATLERSGGDVPDARSGRGEGAGREIGRGSAPARWLPEPDVGRVANGVPRRVDRLRALGNAVVPQIPEVIGRAIMRVDGR